MIIVSNNVTTKKAMPHDVYMFKRQSL